MRDTGQKDDKHETHKQRELRQIVIEIPVELFSDLDQTQIERGFHELFKNHWKTVYSVIEIPGFVGAAII